MMQKLKTITTCISMGIISLSHSQINSATEHIVEDMLKEKVRTTETTHHTNSNDRSSFEESGGEPFIAINPNNEDQVAIIFMGSAVQRRLFLSENGGDTWEESSLSPSDILNELYPTHTIIGGGDPIIIFDNDNTIHASWIYLHGTDLTDPFNNTMETFYATSTDFGTTWNTETSVHSGILTTFDAIDRIWIDADHTGGAYNNNIYISGVHFSASETGPSGQVVFTKESSEESFTSLGVGAIIVDATEQTQYGNIAVDDIGNVHVTAAIIGGDTEKIAYSRSTDGGASFSPHVIITEANLINDSAERTIHNRENTANSLAVDGDNIYIAWTELVDGISKGYYAYSHDNGMTFSAPIDFSHTINGDIYQASMPCVAADDNNLVISWYMYNIETLETRYMSAFSDNGGLTITAFQTLSEESTAFGSLPSSQFYGDYNDNAMHGCQAHFTWSDGRSGSPRIYHSKVDACSIGSGEVSLSEYTPVTESLTINSLYPNPAVNNTSLSITSTKNRDIKFSIFNSSGQLIEHLPETQLIQDNNQFKFDLSNYTQGTYLIYGITSDNYVFTRTFIKQ